MQVQMYDLSPFDQTLFLDADTTVLGKSRIRIPEGRAARHRLLHQRQPVEPALPPHRTAPRRGGVFERRGVLRQSTIRAWARCSNAVGREQRHRGFVHPLRECDVGEIAEQPYNDQALMTLAMQQTDLQPVRSPAKLEPLPQVAATVLRSRAHPARLRRHPPVAAGVE
jgi:hypothetical protein